MVGTASEDVQELTAKAGHAKARFGATVHLAAPLVILCVYIYLSKWDWRRRGQAEDFSKDASFTFITAMLLVVALAFVIRRAAKKDERTSLLSVRSLINVSKKQEAR